MARAAAALVRRAGPRYAPDAVSRIPPSLSPRAAARLMTSRRPLAISFATLAAGLAFAGNSLAAEPAPPADSPSPVLQSRQQASAAELTATMRKALAALAKARIAKAETPTLRTHKARAVRAALADAATQVDALAAALAAKDASIFQAMRRTGSSLAALQVAFRYKGFEDNDTDDNFRKLTAAYSVFRRNYGRDLVTAKTEAQSALTAAQKMAMDSFKKRGAELTKRLAALQPAIKENPAAAFEIEVILRGLARLDQAPRNRRGLLDTLAAAELLAGRWEGTKAYLAAVYPGDAAKLAPADPALAAYTAALQDAVDAAFTGENIASLFAKPAAYAEDIAVEGLDDAEIPALLKTLREPPAADPEPASVNAADRAADREINADDPDDDSSLDTGSEEESAADARND